MKNRPPRTALRTLVRKAYENRYNFDHVVIAQSGTIAGYYRGGAKTNLGHIEDCHTARSTEAGNIHLYNRHILVHTFPSDM